MEQRVRQLLAQAIRLIMRGDYDKAITLLNRLLVEP